MPRELVASRHGAPALRATGPPDRATSIVLVTIFAALALAAGLLPAPAAASEAELQQRQQHLEGERRRLQDELDRAQAERSRLSRSLDEAVAAVDRLTGELNRLRDEMGAIEREVTALEATEASSREHLALRVSALYRGSAPNEFLGLLGGTSAHDLAERSHYLAALTRADRTELETAAAVGRRLAVRRADLADATGRQEAVAEEADVARAELDRQLAAAGEAAAGVRATIAARDDESRQIAGELDARRRMQAQAERQATERRTAEARREAPPSRSTSRPAPTPAAAPAPAPRQPALPVPAPRQPTAPGPAPPPAEPSAPAPAGGSGVVCPQDHPRSFTDTWGAPRGGGRSHQGTDIFGSMGGSVFAVTSGTIEWTRSGANAGLWLSLRGDDGDRYWYMHLSSFVASSGQRVGAGELIARNGNTGNARGASPHIHFEHHPGGGRPVNPYPLLRRACG